MKIIPRASGPTAKMCRRGPTGVPTALFELLLLSFTVLTLNCTTVLMDNTWNVPLSVSSINCNSLNMSNTGAFNHKLKMYGITELRTDIIFMCDIRLSNSQNVPSGRQAALTFRTNPYGAYDFYSNSTRNKRGVGILIKKNSNFSVIEERRDVEENILVLRLLHQGNNREIIIGSIYGPNRVEPQFYNNLRQLLLCENDVPIILGGDWNCTYSSEPVRYNPDLCNMQNLPNKRHSELLLNLCDDLSLADPYRVKFPNKKEYTFIPADPIKRNRSRLDFFIVSRSILDSVTKVLIHPGLQNKLFDHRAVSIEFSLKEKVITPPTVSEKILKDPETELVVGLAVADVYLIYSTSLTEPERINLNTGIGQAWRDLRKAGPSNNYVVPGDRSDHEELVRDGLLASVREFLEFFPFQRVRDGGLNVGDDMFMEVLINAVRNETISYQQFIQKNCNKQKTSLLNRIKEFKRTDPAGSDRIIEAERTLNKQLDIEMRTEIENLSSFEYLNDEKITPYFVSLAKCNKATATTDSICDSDGSPFPSSNLRNEYVRNFYADLYKIPDGQVPAPENCIEEFLGPEICNSNIVRDSKLPAQKAAELEQDITIEELDISAMQGNKSAAGMDGLSNCFIKRFWALLRVPLHRYLRECLRKKSLTFTFKTAKIKIIPKKGDSKKIGNWRPISLLSCLYKVLSRALNNRLKKVRDIIFSRAQKGFTNQRHIQEVLINVIEGIAHCKENNIPACILSIDQAKAFDTVSHSYKKRVFEFFGFGPNFINLLNTLCTGRSACVVFDDGSLSTNFDLDRGDAQGNTPSPVLYNIAQQIFLFKLELCPEIKSVFVNHLIPRPLEFFENPVEEFANLPIEFKNESGRETDKAEGFADDTTGMSLFELESLATLKKILTDFGKFSGLQCNVEKTVLMQVGQVTAPTPEILQLGFSHVDEIRILGMNIDQNIVNLDQNFVAIHEKIRNTIAYWKRYNLSLPGRINVIKSLLVSLINHLGCFLMPKPATLAAIQKSLDDFALSNLRVARGRVTLPIENGGLGLFKLDEFLSSQQSIWVLRADKSLRDNWRGDLFSLSGGNCLGFSHRNVDVNVHPILHGIGLAFERTRICHDNANDNFLNANVLYHPLFFRGPGNKALLDPEYLECADNPHLCKKIANLKVGDCFGLNGLLTRIELRHNCGIDLSVTGYANLGRSLNHFVNRLKANRSSDGSSVSLRENFNIKKPGPKI